MVINVLIVEDEWVIAEDHAGTLRGAGYCIVGPFASVIAALAALDHQRVDVAFLDVELRHERSHALAERLEQLGIPFAYVTGHDAVDIPHDRRKQVLPKPVAPQDLLAVAAGLTQPG